MAQSALAPEPKRQGGKRKEAARQEILGEETKQREETKLPETAGLGEDIEGMPAALDQQIRARAHEIYLAHGGHSQSEIDDWLQAEVEILQRTGNRT